MYINGAFREPTFFYESTLNIVGFLLIVLVYKRISNYKRGDLMYAYLMWYGVTRFFIEGFRSDSLMFFGLRSAQLVSIAFLIAGMLGTLGVFRKIFKREKPIMLFDFDGTLMDTEQTVKDGIKQVILKHQPDLEINPDMENSFVGPPLSETFSRFFEASQIDDLIVEFRVINNEMHKTRVKPIEHAIEVIKELKEQGYLVGVVSSKISSSIHMGMDLFDMRELFDVIIGVDDVKEHKPSPEGIFTACKRLNKGHDAVIYIGDTAIDIQAGHAAGVYTVAMMTNPSRKDELEAEKPNAFITDLRDLFDILKEDVEWTRSTT
jgi:phosphatidylglycerol:prolipoprotein diacylglycerol transferase